MRVAEPDDPRLVALYDAENPWGRDDDFFLAFAGEAGEAPVLDLGCGTGRLTVALAAAGHRVTGVDPSATSLAAARQKPGAERVTWIEGTSRALPEHAFDVAILTSHVAQHVVSDIEWRETLADVKRALRPGGRLAFDSRDPADEAWRTWNRADSYARVTLDGEEVETWVELSAFHDDVAHLLAHAVFGDGDHLVSAGALRFRDERELRTALEAHGYTVAAVYGGWRRQPVGEGDGELIVTATV